MCVKLILALALIFGLLLPFRTIWADQSQDCATLPLDQQPACYQQKITTAQGQEKTLSSQIAVINNEISLTRSQIDLTEQKLGRLSDDIASVSGKIDSLQGSLDHVGSVLIKRIVETYVAGRDDPVLYLLTANNFNDFLDKFNYLSIVQKHDKKLMFQMVTTKKNYNDQKDLLQDKKKQVEVLSAQLKSYKATLDSQNREKQTLLTVTQNDERRYQQLLAEAQQEIAALQASQFVGKKNVKRGDIIGLMGSSGRSTGPHVHFGVYTLSESNADSFNYTSNANNPFDYLQGRSTLFFANSCDDILGQNITKNIGGGNYSWPLDNPGITQCYGHTPYSQFYNNNFHEGVDIVDAGGLVSVVVKAADDGVAYTYRDNGNGFGNNVRVFHPNGKMTLYLHLQ